MKELHCFSGMGNSAAVAARLEELLPEDFADPVWVFPVHAWGVPPVLVKHIGGLDLSGKLVHMVCTYGDEAGNIHQQWRRLIESRGGRVGVIYGIQMPNTYVCFPFMNVDSPAKAADKLARAEESIRDAARAIAGRGETLNIYKGAAPRLCSGVIYPFFFKHLMKAGKWHHTDTCTACGICAANCPEGNIMRDAEGRPVWGADCTFCLRCYHVCKSHSVAYGKCTKKKGQYLHPDFQSNKNICKK